MTPAEQSTALVQFTFEGDVLDVARLPDGDVGVAVRALCGAIGVDVDGQSNRLARIAKTGVRWATTSIMEAVAADGKSRLMSFLPRRSIPMWAATLDASRCAPESRQKIIAYQDRCADVLAREFIDRPVSDPRAVLLTLAQDAVAHGTLRDANILATAVARLCTAPRSRRFKAPVPDASDAVRAFVAALPPGTYQARPLYERYLATGAPHMTITAWGRIMAKTAPRARTAATRRYIVVDTSLREFVTKLPPGQYMFAELWDRLTLEQRAATNQTVFGRMLCAMLPHALYSGHTRYTVVASA